MSDEKEKETKLARREQDFSPASFLQNAIDKGLTPETLKGFMDLYNNWEARKAKKEFDEAMANFQGKCPIIVKGRKVDFESKRTGGRTKYAYASLDQIVKQTQKLIADNGLAYTIKADIETSEGRAKGVKATVVVTHRGGHSESSSFMVPLDPDAFMNEAQKFGTALTYAKRYAFVNAFGILTSDPDTDGNTVNAKGQPVASGNYDHAIRIIQKAKSQDELIEFRSRIEKGRSDPNYAYTPEQCGQLLRLIDARENSIATN